ncbi:hypothetical protein [Massilia violaceinigra]|uniref:hypothetical protein n=1 Tax=Massilia violaceinigra TaxID=2045208 RepID=UPI0012FD58B6|nr:hypothetical protein [Massilia violaceinigra]
MPISIHVPSISMADRGQLMLTLQYIKHSPNFAIYYPNLDGLTIHVGSLLPTIALPTSGQISWNPNQGLQVISDTGILGVQSPAMGLVHEIAHVIFGHNEAQATAFETRVARDLGEPTRANYGSIGNEVRVYNSTQHTDNGEWKSYEQSGATKTSGNYDGSTNAPNMGWGYIPPPPGAPKGWTFPSSPFGMDSNGNLHDASYWQIPPGGQKSVPNNVDTEILEFYLTQEDPAPIAALPIEPTDAQHVAPQIIGLPELAPY